MVFVRGIQRVTGEFPAQRANSAENIFDDVIVLHALYGT